MHGVATASESAPTAAVGTMNLGLETTDFTFSKKLFVLFSAAVELALAVGTHKKSVDKLKTNDKNLLLLNKTITSYHSYLNCNYIIL